MSRFPRHKYEIRRGYRSPTLHGESPLDTATYEVWRLGTFFHSEKLMDVRNREFMAIATCSALNGHKN